MASFGVLLNHFERIANLLSELTGKYFKQLMQIKFHSIKG